MLNDEKEMDYHEKLNLIMETLETLNATIEDLKNQQAELAESILNLSLPGSNYDIDELT